MIPAIDPVIGKVGADVMLMVTTNPDFVQLNPVGRVHDVLPRTNSDGKVMRMYPLAVIGMLGVIEKENTVGYAIIAGRKDPEFIPIEFVMVFIKEYDCLDEICTPDG